MPRTPDRFTPRPRRLEPRSFLLGFVAALAITGGFAAAQGGLDAVVLAIVNNEEVTRGRLVARLLEYHGKDALEKMTNRVLLMQQVDKLGVTLSEAELDKRLQEIRARFGDEENYKRFLTAGGLTEAQHREQTHFTMLLEKCALKDLPIADADLDQYQVRVIVARDKAECQSLIDRVKAGTADFRNLALSFSTDKQSAQYGGLLPPFIKIDYPDMWRAIQAQKLQPGEFTQEPALVDVNYLAIKLESVQPGRELSSNQREKLEARLTGFRMDQFLEQVTRGSQITYPVPLETVIEAAKTADQRQRAAAK